MPEAVPILDLAPLLSGGRAEDWREAVAHLGACAEDPGFFLVRNHGIPEACIARVLAESRAFFGAGEAEKMACYIGRSPNHRGYVPVTEMGAYADEGGRRTYEAFDSALDLPPEDPDHGAHHRLLGPNAWPEGRPGFREALGDYYGRASALARALCGALEAHLGAPADALTGLMRKPTAQLRVIHYLPGEEAASRDAAMGAHTDYECLTLLHQEREGLQVRHPSRGWVTVPALEGTLVVMVGDMLEAFSNGRFRSALHRVADDGRERWSLPFFAATDFDAVVAPHPACLGDGPARYAPVVAGHHLLGQLLRDFPYLRARHARGELDLPSIPSGNPFERRPDEAAALMS